MIADLTQIVLTLALLVALAVPLGLYMAKVYTGEITFLGFAERALLAPAGVKPKAEQHWTSYALSLLAFNAAGFVVLFLILRFQHLLPLNPQGFDGAVGAPCLQHRDLVRHQHQLAELWRRDHHVAISARWSG